VAGFFVRRPIVAMVISIVITIAGLVAMQSLPIAQYPEIVPPQVQVTTTFTGANAETVEQSVATPLEQQINGVENSLYVKSINANDGSLFLTVDFEVGTDLDIANVLVQNRVSQGTPQLPSDVQDYGVTVKKSLTFPLLAISLYSPEGSYDTSFLGNYATININDALKRIPGVGDVKNFGSADYAMRVWMEPDRLATLGLTVNDVQTAVQKQSVVNPAGQIGAEPAPAGQEFTYAVRAQGRLTSPDEFGDIAVRLNPDGSVVRLRDVARLELGTQLYNQRGRYNQKPAVIILLYQVPGSNALAIAGEARRVLDELQRNFPADLAYEVSLDTTAAVTEGINEIVHTLFEAVGLVILVVFIFLQSWRATLIPLLTVPVSLLGAFIFFPIFGFSINTLSLLGLVLAIGLVVDDAIVVVEAVQHHIEHGLKPREATLKAMEEVSGPVVAIALVLSAVFIPVAFMGGITGRLYQQFALTIVFSVMISALNALTLSPALSVLLLKEAAPARGVLGRFFAAFNRGFERLTGGYVRWTGVLMAKTARGLVLLAVAAVAAVVLGGKVPAGFLPDEDQGFMMVNVQLPDAASLQRTDEVAKQVERVLAATPGVAAYDTIVGYSLLTQVSNTYSSFFFVTLHPWHERHSQEETFLGVLAAINRALAPLPEARAFAFLPPAIPGFGTASGFSMMLQDRSGGSVAFLADQADRFLEAARKRPELASLNSALRPSVPQVFAAVDRDKALKLGVDVRDVYAALQVILGGVYVNDFNRFGRQWKVYIQGDAQYRVKPEDIGQFFVRNIDGQMVPLSTLVTPSQTNGPEFTVRFNLYRAAEITGQPAAGYSSGQALAAVEEVAREVLPPEIGYAWNTLAYQQKRAEGGAVVIFAMALLFVFLILAAQYESWSLPFTVLLGTPLAVFGCFLGLFLRGLENNVYAQIGVVMLIGLAAKNAILIVEFAKVEFDNGKDAVAAALEGARLRLRPILMTSFAFILGCVPLWTATGAGAVARRILGTSVIMGMSVATLLGIFITPVLFVVIQRLVGGRAPEPATSGAPVVTPAPGVTGHP
jgi:HAE1 family hydrophobic/amphiphilic exporter-1